MIDASLRAAYLQTRYRYTAPNGEIVMRVDVPNAELRELLEVSGKSCAAVLTAWNPGSRIVSADINERAQSLLMQELQSGGLRCFPGTHEDPSGKWPAEIGVLVPGLSLAAAHEAAARHRQLAFLWCDHTATPQLIETGSE